MRSNGREPLRTSQIAPSRISLHAGERPQVACPICGGWLWLRRGMLRAHRAADQITRCPGSGQPVLVDETPDEWLARLGSAIEASRAGGTGPYVAVRKVLKPLTGHNGRPMLTISMIDPRRVVLTCRGGARLRCSLCGRWREIENLPGQPAGQGIGAHRADGGITGCPGSGQRVVVDETLQQWRARLQRTRRDVARVAPVLRAQQDRLQLEIELHHGDNALREDTLVLA